MDSTERLSLPLIIAGQAQKEIAHNEALEVLDSLVSGAVEDVPANEPPPNPAVGQSFLVGDVPSGEWSQYAGHVASYTSAGWRFIAPVVGMQLLVKATGTFAVYGMAGWEIGSVRAARVILDDEQVVGARAAAIADPSGGTIIDAEARITLGQILSALRQHGLIYS